MSVIFLLIGFSVVVAIVFLVAFIWGTKTGQFDDQVGPAVRMLFDNKVKQDKK